MSNGVSNPIHWRLLYLTVLLLLMLNCSYQECSEKCWFVYKPSDTRSQNQEFTVTIPTDRRIAGIVTIDGQFNRDDTSVVKRNELRFSKADPDYPLVLVTAASFSNDRNQILVFGQATFADEAKNIQYGAQYWPPFTMKLFPDTRINVQLSDMEVTTDRCYKFHIGIPGESEYYEYNYKSDATWAMFVDLRLDATTVISNTDVKNVTSYNYISVCADPEPVLCDNLDYEIVDADLGAPHKLTCSGSGAPYLTSRWDNDTYRPTFEAVEEEYDNSTADQFIRSTVRIGQFTVDHIGSWNCTIVNMNFKGAVHKTYLLQYSSTVTVTARPSVQTYSPTDGNTSLVWVVEGWPLQQVTFTCDMDSNETHTIDHTPDFYSSNPPKVTMTLTLSSPHLQDLVNCRVLDGEEVLDKRTIAKLYNCSPGQYGEGMWCFDCPLGEMSQGGNTNCVPANNSCDVDHFGVGDECRRCPRGTGTEPEEVAVKKQDCTRSIATIETKTDESRKDDWIIILLISLIGLVLLICLVLFKSCMIPRLLKFYISDIWNNLTTSTVELEFTEAATTKESVSKELNVEAVQVKSSPDHATVAELEALLSPTPKESTRNPTTSTSKKHTQGVTTVEDILSAGSRCIELINKRQYYYI